MSVLVVPQLLTRDFQSSSCHQQLGPLALRDLACQQQCLAPRQWHACLRGQGGRPALMTCNSSREWAACKRRRQSALHVRSDDNEFPLFKAFRLGRRQEDADAAHTADEKIDRPPVSPPSGPSTPSGPGPTLTRSNSTSGKPRKPRPGELPTGYTRRPSIESQGVSATPRLPPASPQNISRQNDMQSSRAPKVFPWFRPPRPVEDDLGHGGPGGTEQGSGKGSQWEVWEAWQPFEKEWSEDWEPWEKPERPVGAPRKYPRRMSREGRPRDEYLRPIVDFAGIGDRLSPDEIKTEERILEELDENSRDTKMAVNFAARLVFIPLVVGFIISRLLSAPILTAAENFSDQAFALHSYQKIEGAKELRQEALRLRMMAAAGRHAPLTEEELYVHLHEEALHIADKFKAYNKRSYLNVVSDTIAGITFFTILLRYDVERSVLFRTIGRVFSGLSDTAKAFIIIAVTDILLGYHSEDGWTSVIRLICYHYGTEPEEGPVYAFVAIVPVFLDTCFKYWIFTGLQKEDPAAAVTLRSMDRH